MDKQYAVFNNRSNLQIGNIWNMEKEINLKYIHKETNKIIYIFDYSENLQKYFNANEEFFIEYDGLEVNTIPDGILVIPFLCNILPVVWLSDGIVRVPEIDENFMKSIPEFKKGFENMYPSLGFTGRVIADKVIGNSFRGGEPLAFFSGGVDAFNTLVNHIEEKPVLLTLWGADVFLGDHEGGSNIRNHVTETAKQFSVKHEFAKSNFRKFINESMLTELLCKKVKGGWWGGIQHGIGIIAHAAPVAYKYNSELVYIASSFSAKDTGKVVWGSDPTIDNYVRWANTQVIHDGYEFTRQDKIKNISGFVRKHPNVKILLRVCWQSSGGKNCSLCEKCYRTIMGLLAEGQNPEKYGLFYSKNRNKKIKNDIKYKIEMGPVQKAFWGDIQNEFLKKPDLFIKYPELKWITKINFEKIERNPIRRIKKFKKSATTMVKRITNKALRLSGMKCKII